MKLLEGTYGIVAINKENPDILYVFKNGSPLLIGENENNIMVCSELSGFANQVTNYIKVENNEIFYIDKNGYKSINKNTHKIVKIEDNSLFSLTPAPYEYWTEKEIMEQDQSILRSINNGGRCNDNIIKLGGLNILQFFKLEDFKNIFFLGCGTSYNACALSTYWFKKYRVFKNIQFMDGAEFQEMDLTMDPTIVVFCSQSGETKDLQRCIEICKKYNTIKIGVINVVNSVIANEVDCGNIFKMQEEK